MIDIPPLDLFAGMAAQQRLNILTKPPGSLGRLEDLAVRLAQMTGNPLPSVKDKAILLCIGDHAIAKRGISTVPSVVTTLMTRNFIQGGAAINVLSRQMGARLVVVDVGLETELTNLPNLVQRKVCHGAADISSEPAMTRNQAIRCIETGIELVREEAKKGLQLVAAGDMGIGNTTPSSAIASVLTGAAVAEVTGRGTGIDDAQHARKIQLISQAIALHRPNRADGLDVLAKVGGCEIGAMAGVYLGAAHLRIPAVVDGFIAACAALLAQAINPRVTDYLIAAHASVEPGHQFAMRKLGLEPLFDLNLRLGEGTGAALAFPMIEASTLLLSEMATLEDLGIHLPA